LLLTVLSLVCVLQLLSSWSTLDQSACDILVASAWWHSWKQTPSVRHGYTQSLWTSGWAQHLRWQICNINDSGCSSSTVSGCPNDDTALKLRAFI
jgi:hypothetical protein